MRNRYFFLPLGLGLSFSSHAQQANATAQAGEARTGGAAALPVRDYAEEMPRFTGGAPALRRYLAAKLVYPAEAVQRHLSGAAVVQFVVDEQGRAVDAAVVRTSDPVFDAEARRVVYLMPWWAPGREHGRPVRVRCTLPIVFTFKRG